MLLDHFAHAAYVQRGKALLLLQATQREKLRGKGGRGLSCANGSDGDGVEVRR
jgi:hypothetical protein